MRRRTKARRKNVPSSPSVVLMVGKQVRTAKENMEDTARRIPLHFDREWFGKISEDIRFGKLSGPIWTQNVRIEMTARGANL